MGNSAVNKNLVARAAAILTTGEVAATRLDLTDTSKGDVTLDVSLTLGSLTNVVLRGYVSADGVTWKQIYDGATAAAKVATLTASAQVCIPMPTCGGWKFFRASAQGTGTVTGSSLELRYRYLRRGVK